MAVGVYIWNGALWVKWDGAVTVSGGSGDGVILDGVNSLIRATVKDFTNSNPLTVAIVDADGTQVVSFGGGTQYTEDAVAPANPVGTNVNLVRQDTPAGLVTTDGDNLSQRGTNFGAAYVTLLDTSGNPVAVGGGTQYTEDVAAPADPIGTNLNMVRADALAAITTTDGDNLSARGTNKGELYVKHVDSIPVTGTFFQATQPVSATDLDIRNLVFATDKVDASGTTLGANDGVDIGDVTVNNAAGASAVNVQDGGNSITVDNTVLSVVGGGTEATAQRVTIANDSTGLLSVDDNGGSLTVDGSVTANAGTNLNTSALNLEATQADVRTALQVIDDWDESDRAKVNPIVGQAGIDGGSGISTAKTVRVIAGPDTNIITRRDNYTSAQTDAAIVTVSGGTKIVVLACTVAADKANSIDVAARIGFGTANTPTGAGVYLSHPGIAAGSGIREAGAVVGGDGEDLRITSEVPTGGSIDVVTKYFTV